VFLEKNDAKNRPHTSILKNRPANSNPLAILSSSSGNTNPKRKQRAENTENRHPDSYGMQKQKKH